MAWIETLQGTRESSRHILFMSWLWGNNQISWAMRAIANNWKDVQSTGAERGEKGRWLELIWWGPDIPPPSLLERVAHHTIWADLKTNGRDDENFPSAWVFFLIWFLFTLVSFLLNLVPLPCNLVYLVVLLNIKKIRINLTLIIRIIIKTGCFAKHKEKIFCGVRSYPNQILVALL